jgi:hypothetical protein
MGGYRAILQATAETVQDLELSAQRRLDEALALYLADRNHTAIYLAGLSAEMYLKTACFFLGGARPADPVTAHLAPVKPGKYKPPFAGDFESGHGLWFWSQELLYRRRSLRLPKAPNRFLQVMSSIYMDWFVGMRYRPGSATGENAAQFITQVEWLAGNHAALRR